VNAKALSIINKLAKTKSDDCVGGFYATFEVEESLVEEAKKFLKDLKKKGKK
jgi:hypothetical protein